MSDDLDADPDADDRAFKAMAHRDRRQLLRLIGAIERNVGELAEHSGLAQPIASQHLKVLRDAQLVQVRVDGSRRLYSVDFERLGAVRGHLDDFWNSKLAALKVTAERLAHETEQDYAAG
jgi:DNA-binding transcriptional ArsR family regulator